MDSCGDSCSSSYRWQKVPEWNSPTPIHNI